MTPDLLVSLARSYIGTPWHHAGRLRGVGVDCIGLVAEVYREAGLAIADQLNYTTYDEYERLLAVLGDHASPIIGPLVGGDILVFRHRLMDNHCAIYAGNGLMVHAYSTPAVMRVVEVPFDDSWVKRLQAVYRVDCP